MLIFPVEVKIETYSASWCFLPGELEHEDEPFLPNKFEPELWVSVPQ
jgi:hypothetical protein